VVNAIRVVGHIDDGAGGGVERAVMPVAAAVHLRPRGHAPQQEDAEENPLRGWSFHGISELTIDFRTVLDAIDADEMLRR
jgi:hypothetical protein